MTVQSLWTRRGVLAAGAASVATGASAADLHGDVALLKRAYGALHPGLHRYIGPAALDGAYERLSREFTASPDLGGQLLALTRFTALLKCGHSQANPFNQSRAVEAAVLKPARLPFAFRWLKGEMVVTWSDPAAGLTRGTRVLAVEGRATGDILREMLPLARADGSNLAKRVAQLAVSGTERYESFDINYPLLFGPLGDQVRLRVVAPGQGRATTVDITALPGGGARRPTPDTRSDAAVWTLDRDPGGVVRLTMPDWALYDSGWDWKGFLESALDEAAAARGLIIDLRGNEGGLDCGDAILQRLVRRDTRPLQYRRLTRYRRTPDDLNRYLETWDKSFRDWGAEAVGPDAAGFYALTDEPGDARTLISPRGKPVGGKAVVLVDAACSSATFQFAQIVKDAGLATLVGTPTGGNRRGINGGAFFFLRLPASGLEADLPLIGRFPESPQPDAGITPDLAVQTTAADIAAGRDPVLARALAAFA